jgi:hypothetical protein
MDTQDIRTFVAGLSLAPTKEFLLAQERRLWRDVLTAIAAAETNAAGARKARELAAEALASLKYTDRAQGE